MPTINFTDEMFTEKQKNVIGKFIKILNEKYEEYDYIVLTARRCFCFINSLLLNGNEMKKDKFISSQAINIHAEEFKNKKILLCDDIMIHGQSIYSMYKKILACNPKNIDILVMIRNIEKPDYFTFKANVDYEVVVSLDDEDWRKFSNNIVRFIHSQSVLYISYIYGFNCSHKFFEHLSNNLMLKKLHLENDILVHDYYLSEDYEPKYFKLNEIKDVFPLDIDFINFAVLRAYKNPKEEDSYWLLPYVELKEIKSDALNRVFISLGKIDEKFNVIKTPCEQYKALTAIFSVLLLIDLGGRSYINGITNYIDNSYFNGFAELIVNNIAKEDILAICKKEITFFDIYVHDDLQQSEMIRLIDSHFQDNLACNIENFKKYFATLNLKDEDEFRLLFFRTESEDFKVDYVEELKTIKPVRSSSYYKKFAKTQESFANALKYTLYFSDNGVVSFVVNEFVQNDENFVGAYIKSGEQSYRMHADYAREYFSAIYYLYDLLIYYNDFDIRKKKAEKILNYFKENFEQSFDVSRFEFFLREHFTDLFYLPDYFFATSKDKINIDELEEKRILIKVKNALKEVK